eukprot:1662265-Prymnesium_polylepis.1
MSILLGALVLCVSGGRAGVPTPVSTHHVARAIGLSRVRMGPRQAFRNAKPLYSRQRFRRGEI